MSLGRWPSKTRALASLIQTANRFTVDNEFVAIFGQEFSSISSGNNANVYEVTDVIDVPNGDRRPAMSRDIAGSSDGASFRCSPLAFLFP